VFDHLSVAVTSTSALILGNDQNDHAALLLNDTIYIILNVGYTGIYLNAHILFIDFSYFIKEFNNPTVNHV